MSTVSDLAQRVKHSNLQETYRNNKAFLLVAPGLFLWLGFMVIPMGYVTALSLTNATNLTLTSGSNTLLGIIPIGGSDVVWFENYAQLIFSEAALEGSATDLLTSNPLGLFNGQFWNSFLVTWLFVILSVVGKVILGIGISLVLTGERVRGKRLMRGIIIMPMGIPPIFSIVVWRAIFSEGENGLANKVVTGLGFEQVQWFSERWTAFMSYVVTEMWLAYPFMVLITVSALQNVNDELLDAAKVDGAGYFQRLRHVVLPSIKRPVMFGTILTAAASFQQFLVPWVFNRGGPVELVGGEFVRQNELLLVFAYAEALGGSSRSGAQQMGLGSAISILTVFFIGLFMYLAVKRGRLAEEAGEA